METHTQTIGFKASKMGTKPKVIPGFSDPVAETQAIIADARPSRQCPMVYIIEAACMICHVPPELINHKCRTKTVVLCRQLIVVVARELTFLSFPEICKELSRKPRNHSTMIEAYYKYHGNKRYGPTMDVEVECSMLRLTKREFAKLIRTTALSMAEEARALKRSA